MSIEPIRAYIHGVPYCQSKVRGKIDAAKQWSDAVKAQTAGKRKVAGRCRLEVTFFLPPNKYPADHPHGPDLDNLIKRLGDALSHTVLSTAPGKDGAIVELDAKKKPVKSTKSLS